jgi:type I restriction enzyme S subunit
MLLGTPALRGYFQLSYVGSTLDNLNADIVLGTPVVVPPVHEQQEILRVVKSSATPLKDIIERATRQVTLLAEHRQALVTAAVTGELDLVEAA